jgi:hypothetical protein
VVRFDRVGVVTLQGLLQPRQDVLLASLVIPIIAALIMAGLESLVENVGWRRRLVQTGWDLCVLAVGVIAGIFGAPARVARLGAEAVNLSIVAVLVAVGAAIVIMHIRKTPPEKTTGLRGLLALLCGGMALALPWYFVVRY